MAATFAPVNATMSKPLDDLIGLANDVLGRLDGVLPRASMPDWSKVRAAVWHLSALGSLPRIADMVRNEPYRFILVCDDLSFSSDDASYKELKSVLEGSVFRSSANVLIYATSNRRHLLPEHMADNLAATHEGGELHESEAVEEKISLSDRFGVWLSFQPFKQDAYLDVVAHWLQRIGGRYGLHAELTDSARREALQWALARGARNGRTAQYFARDWIGRLLTERGAKLVGVMLTRTRAPNGRSLDVVPGHS